MAIFIPAAAWAIYTVSKEAYCLYCAKKALVEALENSK